MGADDLIDLPVARHRALVDGGGTLGDVRPAGPRPGISPLRGSGAGAGGCADTPTGAPPGRPCRSPGRWSRCTAPAPPPQRRGPRGSPRGAPQAQLPADPIPQRPRHRQAPRATSSPLPVGAPLRRRRAITPTAATSGNLTGDRRPMAAHAATDRRPTHRRILN